MLRVFLDFLGSCKITLGYLPYKITQLFSIYKGQCFPIYLVIQLRITHVVHYMSFNPYPTNVENMVSP
jgi:hypothetical protein